MEHEHHSSSSEDEDGDEQWKAAINAAASAFLGTPTPTPASDDDGVDAKSLQPHPIKHYQIKAQKVLDDILMKSLDMVKNSEPVDNVDDPSVTNGGGIRLFKQAPVGIVFDHTDEYNGPKRKPRILPGEDVNEKSKKFKRRLQCVVVEGMEILETAKVSCQKSLSKLKAKEAAAKEAAKREEERVAQLKKIRGERWLPSIAREMQVKSRVR
ncbi:hypothetical protein BVRB_6g128190 [Beta vulgaris subsp. vulgaris]|uniref:uncharacterized protein LOC104894955 isoform X2 n=1 Tax=Beta vulgaris subsp. vulgaris TaxID=3555 RepID=UPI00053F5704|nr:uncharacterized protein LOC104894955 isoform X2 [Beta vulgaris subsp. vulgaris]KMT09844.1 hypothetical protein BVRB_6g128190 [Beta vulgaris subsp. vulgaris]